MTVTATPGWAATVTGTPVLACSCCRRSTRTTSPAEVPTKRSSPRLSNASAATSPSPGIESVVRISSLADGPTRAFRSLNVTRRTSRPPIVAAVTGPSFVTAWARCRIGRPAGSARNAFPTIGSGLTERIVPWWETANFTSTGITRPSEVPSTPGPRPRGDAATIVAPPRSGRAGPAMGFPSLVDRNCSPEAVTRYATSRYSSTPRASGALPEPATATPVGVALGFLKSG